MSLVDDLQITELRLEGDNRFVSKMKLSQYHAQPIGFLNGGATLAYAEAIAGRMSFELLPEGSFAVGQSITAQHVHSTRCEGYLHAAGELLHKGRRSHVWNIRMTDDSGALISQVTVTCAIVNMK